LKPGPNHSTKAGFEAGEKERVIARLARTYRGSAGPLGGAVESGDVRKVHSNIVPKSHLLVNA